VIYYAKICKISPINRGAYVAGIYCHRGHDRVATLIAFIAIGLGELFGPKKKSAAKDMPYESGMNPYGEGTRRMPVRFY
jgi:hypothetical protein